MTKEHLAQELRERLKIKGLMPEHALAAATDEQVLVSYVMCSKCKNRGIDDLLLYQLVALSQEADQFLALARKHSDQHPCEN